MKDNELTAKTPRAPRKTKGNAELFVVPAQAGTQRLNQRLGTGFIVPSRLAMQRIETPRRHWVPAFAGTAGNLFSE